jgi:hypothetical protein
MRVLNEGRDCSSTYTEETIEFMMPNGCHLVVWPRKDGELSERMRWLTVTHTQRWHAHRRTAGTGPVCKGRFKSFAVQSDEHFLTVALHLERSTARANLVARAHNWRWSGPVESAVTPGPWQCMKTGFSESISR